MVEQVGDLEVRKLGVHLLAPFGAVRWRRSKRMSPDIPLRETNAKNAGPLTGFSKWRARHERLLETFVRTSPAQNECLQAQNECLLETFNAECLQARAGAAGAGDTITTIISYVPGLLLFCGLCGHESTCSLHI